MDLKEYLREYRASHGLSQRQFAESCGLSNGYISMIERGYNPKTKEPIICSLPTLNKLAAGMHISLNQLLTDIDDTPVALGISVENILNDPEIKKTPTLTKKDERDIAKNLEAIMADLEHSGDLMFDGDPMSDEARESMRNAIELGLKAVKLLNKETYTPNKHKKG